MLARFRVSGSESLRAFVFYHYLTDMPSKLVAATMIGVVTGAIGSAAALVGRSAADPPVRSDQSGSPGVV
jgi:hypothetical protein